MQFLVKSYFSILISLLLYLLVPLIIFCTPTDGIRESKFPLKGQILSFFLHFHINNGNTIRDSTITVVNHVLEFWEKASIPIIH